MAVVTLSLAAGSIRRTARGTGFLVPRTSTVDGRPALITGCTYLGRKWPHLARPGDELIRVSVGRFGDDRHRQLDDDELAASVFGELAAVLDIRGTPLATAGHPLGPGLPPVPGRPLIRVAKIEQDVADLTAWPWPAPPCGAWASPPASAADGRRPGGVARPRRSARPDGDRPPEPGPPAPGSGPGPGADPACPRLRATPVRPDRCRPRRAPGGGRRGSRMTHRSAPPWCPRRGMVALPALAAGVGLALSLPPWGWWILAFPAAGLLWWRLGGLRPRTRLWAGWLAGLGCYVPGLMWARSFTVPGAVVLIAVEAVFIARGLPGRAGRTGGGPGPGLPGGPDPGRGGPDGLALRRPSPRRRVPRPGRRPGPRGGPPGRPAGPTAAVYLGGVGVGALVEAVVRAVRDGARARRVRPNRPAESDRRRAGGRNPVHAPAPSLVGRCRRRPRPAGAGRGGRRRWRWSGPAWPPTTPPTAGPSVGTVTAAAVQGGGARGFRKSQIDPSVVLAAQMAATRLARASATTAQRPQLVLWPEDVVSLDTAARPSRPRRRCCPTWPGRLHTTLVVGVTETVSSTAFRNEVVAWGPDGTLVSRYEKVHRVPFGEYVPYRSFFAHLANLSAVPLDAMPGTGDRPAAHAGRPARGHDLLRGVLRRPGPARGAGRRPAADRPHQHLVLRHRPGADPGDRRLRGPGRAAGPRPAPGRAHRVQRGHHQPGGAAATVRCSGPARS